MKKWQKWLVVGAAALTCASSIGSFVNTYKDKDAEPETGTETACVQVVEG